MPDSWNSIDGVALDWDNPNLNDSIYYFKAIYLAYRERIQYSYLNSVKTPAELISIYDAEFHNIESVLSFLAKMIGFTATGTKGFIEMSDFYVAPSGACWARTPPVYVPGSDTPYTSSGFSSIADFCSAFGIAAPKTVRLNADVDTLKTELKKYKTLIENLRYISIWGNAHLISNFQFTGTGPTDLYLSWPVNSGWNMAGTLKIAGYTSFIKPWVTGTSPVRLTNFSRGAVIDINDVLVFNQV